MHLLAYMYCRSADFSYIGARKAVYPIVYSDMRRDSMYMKNDVLVMYITHQYQDQDEFVLLEELFGMKLCTTSQYQDDFSLATCVVEPFIL